MRLSPNFTLPEFLKSQTALRLGVDMDPPPPVVEALRTLCVEVLQPVRDHFGPVSISSGWRPLKVNRAIGSSDGSQHVRGEAADFEVPGVSNHEVCKWIEDNLTFDQLILEFYTPGQPNSGWVHVSYTEARPNRKHALTIARQKIGGRWKTVTLPGLVA